MLIFLCLRLCHLWILLHIWNHLDDIKNVYIEDGKIIYIKSDSNFYYKVTVNPIDDKLVYDYEKLSEIDNEMYEKVFATKEE